MIGLVSCSAMNLVPSSPLLSLPFSILLSLSLLLLLPLLLLEPPLLLVSADLQILSLGRP